jgi:hypothetical protein
MCLRHISNQDRNGRSENKEKDMNRTSWIVILVTALVMVVAPSATSAANSSGYQSITAILGSDGNPASPPVQARDYSSPNAILGASVQPRSENRSDRDYTSITAILGGVKSQSETPTSPVEKPGYRSISSIVGPVEVTPERETSVVRERGGFDWGDAFVGAVAAVGLGLASVLTVSILRRRRRVLVQSRA